MASLFKGYNRDIKYLLPPSVTDWLQAGHLAYFVSDIVDKLDLSEIKNTYKEQRKNEESNLYEI